MAVEMRGSRTQPANRSSVLGVPAENTFSPLLWHAGIQLHTGQNSDYSEGKCLSSMLMC